MSEDLGPNAGLIGRKGSRDDLATPAILLDLDVFERNMQTLARLCAEAGLALRPHGKTHKCSKIAALQVENGACGICCATVHEAEAMVRAGIPGVLITSPVIGEIKIARLLALARTAPDLMVVVDHPANARDLDAAAGAAGVGLSVLVDVDIGMARTGVASAEDAVALAGQVAAAANLSYCGIQAYSGRVQHIEAFDERAATYGAQLARLEAVRRALVEAGLPPAIVSGGGTGTFAIDRARKLFTEHQAGSYIFMDVEYNQVELFPDGERPFATGLFVLTTVVSANAAGFVTVDGGYKCFATDGPEPQIWSGAPDGAVYKYFGDEHGRIVFAHPDDRLEVGAKVALVTPHCDPTINLHDYYHCLRGQTLADIWPIDARGAL